LQNINWYLPNVKRRMSNFPYLEKINFPEDLRKLNIKELPAVCRELRQFIVENVSKAGGHFASNLGTVELATALHYVFNTPEDELVWDTGHQAYPHKILTGRRDKFSTNRKYHGLSGFPSPNESKYDTYYVGHAGTSISVALGLAKARDLNHKSNHAVAIIGDGSMTSGLALEALNNVHGTKRFLVILNDNEVSISRTAGALAKHFSKIVSSPKFRYIKHEIGMAIGKTPGIGHKLTRAIMRVLGGIKHVLAPQNVFENMGFHYLGPFNGHNVKELVKILRACRKETNMPVLLHVITKKGKGFERAECDPESYHGVTPFDKITGKSEKTEKMGKNYTEIFSEVLDDFAEKNDKIVVISAAMCSGTGMASFAEKFPSRFVDVGIAEQHAVTLAGGMAARGFRPVVTIYSTFLQRAYDEIEHDVCLPNSPVIFAIDRAGLVGSDGKTHHGVFDIAYLRHLPGMKIFMPRDTSAMRKIFDYALSQNYPCAIRYPRMSIPSEIVVETLTEFSSPEATNWEVLKKGNDLTILATGHMVYYAFRAAQILEENGISATVIDACSIRPLDISTLKKVNYNNLVTIEDHVLAGGFGSSVAETLADENLKPNILRIGIPDKFVEHGTLSELYTELGWQPEQLAERIKEWLN